MNDKILVTQSSMPDYQEYVEEIKKYRSVWSKDPLFSSADRWICRLLLHRQIARLLFLLKKAL